MRTLVTVPEFRQCGPVLSFLDNAETETPSDKVTHSVSPLMCDGCVGFGASHLLLVFRGETSICNNLMRAGFISRFLARPMQKMRLCPRTNPRNSLIFLPCFVI